MDIMKLQGCGAREIPPRFNLTFIRLCNSLWHIFNCKHQSKSVLLMQWQSDRFTIKLNQFIGGCSLMFTHCIVYKIWIHHNNAWCTNSINCWVYSLYHNPVCTDKHVPIIIDMESHKERWALVCLCKYFLQINMCSIPVPCWSDARLLPSPSM